MDYEFNITNDTKDRNKLLISLSRMLDNVSITEKSIPSRRRSSPNRQINRRHNDRNQAPLAVSSPPRYRAISQPLPSPRNPFKSVPGRRRGWRIYSSYSVETGVVGCRNTSTNYRETGIRGHPEGPTSGPANQLSLSLSPSSSIKLIKPEISSGVDFISAAESRRETR